MNAKQNSMVSSTRTRQTNLILLSIVPRNYLKVVLFKFRVTQT